MSKSQIVREYLSQHEKRYLHKNVTCGELLDIQKEFYKSQFNFFKITEFMVFDIINYFYTVNGYIEKFNSTLYLNKKFKGTLSYLGKVRKQELDIAIGSDDVIDIGISMKLDSENSNSYFDGADFVNPLFVHDYAEKAIPDKDRFDEAQLNKMNYYIDPILQDMGRINNLQMAQKKKFESLTIVFNSIRSKDNYWVNEFQSRFGHNHLFLGNHKDQPFLEMLEFTLPIMKTIR